MNREQRICDRLSLWSQLTFGSDSDRGPEGALAHLAREVAEVQAAPKDLIEYADCWILLVDACRRAGFTYEDLLSAVEAKSAINRVRTWSAPDAQGVCVHVVPPASAGCDYPASWCRYPGCGKCAATHPRKGGEGEASAENADAWYAAEAERQRGRAPA